MRELFKPWRRRFGVVALGLALLLMAGWVRSHFHRDTLFIKAGEKWNISFMSHNRGLCTGMAAYGTEISTFSLQWTTYPADLTEDPMRDVVVPIRLDFSGFHFGCKGFNPFLPRYFARCFVSYWYPILPLALLSTWLLLSKPRQAKQCEPSPPPDHHHA